MIWFRKHADLGPLRRLRWSLTVRRHPKTLAGWLRLWWHDFVIHPIFEGGERCQDCGCKYVLWWSDDEDLWRKGNDGNLGGLLCPMCFAKRLDKRGVVVRFYPQVVRTRY